MDVAHVTFPAMRSLRESYHFRHAYGLKYLFTSGVSISPSPTGRRQVVGAEG